MTEKEIKRAAELYAEEQNSCYTSDYNGFIAGFKYARMLYGGSIPFEEAEELISETMNNFKSNK